MAAFMPASTLVNSVLFTLEHKSRNTARPFNATNTSKPHAPSLPTSESHSYLVSTQRTGSGSDWKEYFAGKEFRYNFVFDHQYRL